MTNTATPHSDADWRRLHRLVIAAGIGWSLAFVGVGVAYGLQMYGDGSFFSYAVAVEEAWAYHWHNISGRVFVYLVAHAPAELYAHLTGDISGAVALYGALFFAGPLVGLAATYALDHSPRRLLTTYACLSTACLCPFIFGSPTETWMSHAAFWPALAACHGQRRTALGWLLACATMVALVMTHEGALLFAANIAATVALRGVSDSRAHRTAIAFAVALAVWLGVKLAIRPDPYLAEVLGRNALNLLDLKLLFTDATLLAPVTLTLFALLALALRAMRLPNATTVAALLAAAWLLFAVRRFDATLLADARYTLRTFILAATPVVGCIAAIHALHAGHDLEPRWRGLLANASALASRLPLPGARDLIAALLLLTLVHAAQTAQFVRAWDAYRHAVAALGENTDVASAPDNPDFVPSDVLGDKLNRLSWFSTTQYLSVLVAPGFAPRRLVIDPDPLYFWISCQTATRTEAATRAIPLRSRRLIRVVACLHRP